MYFQPVSLIRARQGTLPEDPPVGWLYPQDGGRGSWLPRAPRKGNLLTQCPQQSGKPYSSSIWPSTYLCGFFLITKGPSVCMSASIAGVFVCLFVFCFLFFVFFFWFVYGHSHGIWKFLDQGSNLNSTCNLCCSGGHARSLNQARGRPEPL